jgi:hypothetical protein
LTHIGNQYVNSQLQLTGGDIHAYLIAIFQCNSSTVTVHPDCVGLLLLVPIADHQELILQRFLEGIIWSSLEKKNNLKPNFCNNQTSPPFRIFIVQKQIRKVQDWMSIVQSLDNTGLNILEHISGFPTVTMKNLSDYAGHSCSHIPSTIAHTAAAITIAKSLALLLTVITSTTSTPSKINQLSWHL